MSCGYHVLNYYCYERTRDQSHVEYNVYNVIDSVSVSVIKRKAWYRLQFLIWLQWAKRAMTFSASI